MFGKAVEQALECMRNEKNTYKDFIPPEAIDIGDNVYNVTMDLWVDVKEKIIKLLLQEIPFEYPYPTVWWYSVVCAINKNPKIYLDFVKYIRDNQDKFSVNTLYFLYYQLKAIAFMYSDVDGYQGKEELWKLFQDIVSKYAGEVSVSLENIPIEKRDEELVIVITEQFISTVHGPTKTALDRCKVLIGKLNKRVVLINTAEVLSMVGKIPFCEVNKASYNSKKNCEHYQEWKGVQIPYIQCQNNMPNTDTLNKLLSMIRELAPSRIVSIGGSGILSNLANMIIPTITVGLCPADLEYTTTAFQTLSRPLNNVDRQILSRLGYSEKHVIESVFTSSLKPQKEKITKKDLQISEDSFLMIVVGARLDQEVTDEFLTIMNDIVHGNMILGFVGRFYEYDTRISKYANLREHSRFFGFCEDILSRMEVCDLYVNPYRKGGGTSCVEAMYMGVPVVTCGYGDVSVNVGEDFWVKDYSEMKRKILQYYNDKEFYKIMSEKAKRRTEKLLDTEGEFVRILDEVDKREADL